MIKTIHLRNFQSHKSSNLNLVPGINVITGASDCGKTAILRALNWMINNRPTGDAFRSSWGGETAVVVETDDYFVERVKGDKVNEYRLLDKLNQEEAELGHDVWQTLKAMGTDVPEEVTRVLNMGPVNVQSQMDAPFMLSLTPGEAGRQLNQVVNLEVIDRTVSGVNSRLKQAQADKARAAGDVSRATEELAGFDYLPAAEADLEKIESSLTRRDEAAKKAEALVSLASRVRGAAVLLSSFTISDDAEAGLADLQKTRSAREAIATRESRLCRTLYDLAAANKTIEEIGDVDEEREELDRIISRVAALDDRASEARGLSSLAARIRRADEAAGEAARALAETEAEYERTRPEVCPLCGSVMKK